MLWYTYSMISSNFVIIGVLLQFFGSFTYIIDTITGKVQPNRVSWLLWSIAPLIAFAAMLKQNVNIVEASGTFIVGFVPLIILFASFVNKKAEWKITKFDLICGFLSIVGLILWLVTKVGNVAIFFSIIADGLAALPTIVKSYKEPETENSTPFFFGVINAGIILLVITTWNFENFGFPIYLFIVNLLLFLLIKFKLGKRYFVGK